MQDADGKERTWNWKASLKWETDVHTNLHSPVNVALNIQYKKLITDIKVILVLRQFIDMKFTIF